MNTLALFKQVRTFVFDVDGVMTDGTLWLSEREIPMRKMHIRDGYALQLAIKKGFKVGVISGAASPAVAARLKALGIRDIFLGVEEKKETLVRFMASKGVSAEEMLYMGDDMPDYAAMQIAAVRCCPRDACSDIKSICQYISPLGGGEGCVRDVVEKVLRLNHAWE
jgi:3-deoxy-D-manno-octulosonate 8-phosphate phosphatase (KDO 8-P phosphatase)